LRPARAYFEKLAGVEVRRRSHGTDRLEHTKSGPPPPVRNVLPLEVQPKIGDLYKICEEPFQPNQKEVLKVTDALSSLIGRRARRKWRVFFFFFLVHVEFCAFGAHRFMAPQKVGLFSIQTVDTNGIHSRAKSRNLFQYFFGRLFVPTPNLYRAHHRFIWIEPDIGAPEKPPPPRKK